jgi:hypothetical protein
MNTWNQYEFQPLPHRSVFWGIPLMLRKTGRNSEFTLLVFVALHIRRKRDLRLSQIFSEHVYGSTHVYSCPSRFKGIVRPICNSLWAFLSKIFLKSFLVSFLLTLTHITSSGSCSINCYWLFLTNVLREEAVDTE